jgi:polyphenol oxidase
LIPATVEFFPCLEALPGVTACFVGRIPAVDVSAPRHEAMSRLAPHHRRLLNESGLGAYPLVTAEQIHGSQVAILDGPTVSPLAGMDGLLTTRGGLTLGIYVADCAPVWVVARDGSAGALLHSGKKGTELGIVPNGIRALLAPGNLSAKDLVVVIGPCIRSPCYEVDFASEIARQARAAGVTEIHDGQICTACHPERYYSYRREHGLTGRMLATLTLLPA